MTTDRVSVRYAASGLIEVLAVDEVERRIRDGRLGPIDRVARPDGVFVRWASHARFAALATESGRGAPGSTAAAPHATEAAKGAAPSPRPTSAAPLAATPPEEAPPVVAPPGAGAERTDAGRAEAASAVASGPVRADAPEAALRAARERVDRSRAVVETMDRLRTLQGSSGSLPAASGTRSGKHAAIVRPVLDAALLERGPEAVRSALLEATPEEILGIEASASPRRVDGARAQASEAIESAWPPGDHRVRESGSRAARVDAMRIVTAAHRVLTSPSDRARYDRLQERLGRPPAFSEAVEFVPTLGDATTTATGALSDEDEAVLRYVGFDTERLQDEAPAAARAAVRPAAAANHPARNAGAILRSRQGGLLAVLIAVSAAGLLLGPCSAAEEDTGEFRVVAE